MLHCTLILSVSAVLGFRAVPRGTFESQNYRSAARVWVINPLPQQHEPMFQVRHPRYPPYPYFDAPRNLYFDSPEDSNASEGSNKATYLENAAARREGDQVYDPNTGPLAVLEEVIPGALDDYVYTPDDPEPEEEMVTDLAEYDALNPGFGPWPSVKLLQSLGVDVDTSMRFRPDQNSPMAKVLKAPECFTKEIKTIGEAKIEQRRWLKRTFLNDWGLDYDEFAELPLRLRETYYANRYQRCDASEKFLNVLHYRRSLDPATADKYKHPLEFRYMEDSYTFSPKKSPVQGDLGIWDDPLDAPWRLRANEVICDVVSFDWPADPIRLNTGLGVYDITWLPGVVKVVIVRSRDEGGEITPKECQLLLMKLERRLEELDDEEFTQVTANHIVVVVTKPTDSKHLVCRRDWSENIGKDVSVVFNDRYIQGVMQGSDSVFGVKIQVDGKIHIYPVSLIKQIKLL